jgi:hypothetical protein
MEIKYTDKLVAFIDVLGFANLVYSDTKEPLLKYFNYVIEEFTADSATYHFDYLLISDSIVIYADATKENFELMCIAISKLQMKLITRGIIVRGGLSSGGLYIDKSKSIIVGTALINAYQLENEAQFPRVIIDRGFINKYYDNIIQMEGANHGRITVTPPHPYLPDYPYINYTGKLAIVMQMPKLCAVAELLRTHLGKNTHLDKYHWLKNHILYSIESQKQFLANKEARNWRDRKRESILTKFHTLIETL